MEPKTFYVYVYFTACANRLPCYVGKGSKSRIEHHVQIARDEMRRGIVRSHHNRPLIDAIISAGGDLPREVVFITPDEQAAFDEEKRLIDLYGIRDSGGLLLNRTMGGDGCSGYRHPPHIKELIGKMKRGKPGLPCPEERKEHMRKMSTGRKHAELAKQLVSAARKGKKLSPELCALMSARMKGKTSPRKGIPMSEEQKAKLRAANLGKKQSDETKLKRHFLMIGNQYARKHPINGEASRA